MFCAVALCANVIYIYMRSILTLKASTLLPHMLLSPIRATYLRLTDMRQHTAQTPKANTGVVLVLHGVRKKIPKY